MKCVIFLSLVALCHSYPYTSGYGSGYGTGYGSSYGSGYGYGSPYSFEKNYFMTPDGSIAITDASGKIVTLQRGIGQNVGVVVTDPYVGGYTDYPFSYGYQPHQADSLAKILIQYQGEVNPYVYQQLLDEVRSAVQVGLVSDSIYQALLNFNQVGSNQWGYFGQTGFAGNPWNAFGGGPMSYPGSGSSTRKSLMNRILYGANYAPYNQYYQSGSVGTTGPFVTGNLAQIAEGEREILYGQNQIHAGQFLQQHQQKQLMNEQWLQKQRQPQQQDQQEFVKDVQQEVEQEQQEVIEQQKQQTYSSPLKYFMGGVGPWTQTGYWQRQPGVYSLGGYGAYGQGFNRYNVPMGF